MTLTKDKTTGVWKATVKTLDGKTRTLSTRATDKKEAKAIVAQSNLMEIEAAARAGKLTTKGLNAILGSKKVTMPMAVKSFLEALQHNAGSPVYIHQAEGVLNRFIIHQSLQDTLVPDVTERQIYAFINEDSGAGASWRKTQLSIIRSLFTLAVHREWRIGNPAKVTKVQMHKLKHKQKEKRVRVPFTDKEVETLLAMLDGEIHALEHDLNTHPNYVANAKDERKEAIREARFWSAAIALGRYTGVRLGDIAQMEHDCFAQPRKIIVWTDKRDRRVTLPLQPAALRQAIAAIQPVDMTYLFPHYRDIYLDPNRRSNLSTYFRRICERAKIHGKTFHDLRRRYVEACFEAGMPIEHISERVGHRNPATTVNNYMPTYKEVINFFDNVKAKTKRRPD